MGARALSRDSTLGACTRAALDKSSAENPFPRVVAFATASASRRGNSLALDVVGCQWILLDVFDVFDVFDAVDPVDPVDAVDPECIESHWFQLAVLIQFPA